jgi:hypothetical protein
MPGILTRGETTIDAYQHQERSDTIFFPGTITTTGLYPLVQAVERDIWVDKVYVRFAVTGTATTSCQLERCGDADAGSGGGTNMSAAKAVHGVANNTITEIPLYDDTADVDQPRKLAAATNECLYMDIPAAAGTPTNMTVYVRWRTAAPE